MFAGNRRASKIMKGIEFYAIASFLILDVFFCTKSVLLLMIVANYNYLCVFFVIDGQLFIFLFLQ